MHIELKLDKRRMNNSGKYPVKVYLSEGRKTRMVSTGIEAEEDCFDVFIGEVIGCNTKAVNDRLAMMLRRSRIETEGLNLDEAVARVRHICNFDGSMSETFVQLWNRCVSSGNYTPKTIRSYAATLKLISQYCDVDRLKIESVDSKWVKGFQSFLLKRSKLNSAALILSKLKRVVHFAIEEELISKNPFLSVKIRHEETEKRCLPAKEIARLRDMELHGTAELARDMFMLSFYLLGMNTVDMYNASPARDGRVSYRRAKTGKLYDVKVEPEAAAIIEKYAGGDKLLLLSKRYSNSDSMALFFNKHLKRMLPGVTMYWARHSWATIAFELDIPIDVISLALGHSFGLQVTSVYVKPNRAKVDAANRLVLDHLRKISQNGSSASSSGVR